MGVRSVWLVGMMGAGKSAVGPLLAARLGLPFVDTDAEIERTSGMSIPEIFETEGEAGFRKRERAALEAAAGEPAVVALGGGAIAQRGAREWLRERGTVVYLRARPETLLERVGDAEARPLLRGLGPEERLARLRALLAEREPAYLAADRVVDTDDAGAEALADDLARKLLGATP